MVGKAVNDSITGRLHHNDLEITARRLLNILKEKVESVLSEDVESFLYDLAGTVEVLAPFCIVARGLVLRPVDRLACCTAIACSGDGTIHLKVLAAANSWLVTYHAAVSHCCFGHGGLLMLMMVASLKGMQYCREAKAVSAESAV
jgi:hypothetical protein